MSIVSFTETKKPSFADWFGAELDKKLATIPTLERAEWLADTQRSWEYRYAKFVGSQGDSEEIRGPHPTYGYPTATDFILFLGEISKRRFALQAVA